MLLLLGFILTYINADNLSILQELYSATNGDYWTDNTGWNTTNIKNFFGIEVDSSGNIVTIGLTGNNLTGYLPSSLGNLSTVTDFEIAKNNLSGSLPDFSSWSGLQYFDIHFNKFSDVFPDYFYNFKNIEQIDVGYNNISGKLTDSVSNWVRLQFLGVANNSFSGPIPTGLPRGLTRLWLSGNGFSGPVPSDLASLTNIQVLDLSRNNLSGTVPDIFAKFTAVKDILLNNNQLSGVLPTQSILRLTTLSVLGIHNNNFTALPAAIFTHPTLFAFTAQNNYITDSFPAADVNTTVVIYANLSGPNNKFSGEIPEWAQWTGANSQRNVLDGPRKDRRRMYFETVVRPLQDKVAAAHRWARESSRSRVSVNSMKVKKSNADDGIVQVEYYGYSKCPYYVALTDQIQQIPTDLYPYFNLTSYFFGVFNNDYPARYWSMHGQGEAFGDYATQCAIHLAANQSQWLNFTACVNDAHSYGDVPINTATCAVNVGINLEAIKYCIRNNGFDYLSEGTAHQTQRGVLWSPTLYFNGVEGNGDGDSKYLVNTICSLYSGTQPLPASCNK